MPDDDDDQEPSGEYLPVPRKPGRAVERLPRPADVGVLATSARAEIREAFKPGRLSAITEKLCELAEKGNVAAIGMTLKVALDAEKAEEEAVRREQAALEAADKDAATNAKVALTGPAALKVARRNCARLALCHGGQIGQETIAAELGLSKADIETVTRCDWFASSGGGLWTITPSGRSAVS